MRIAAFDDGFFPLEYKGRRGNTILLGVVIENFFEIKNIAYTSILIDGLCVTNRIIEMLDLLGKIDLVMLDGITYAGFDVAEPDKIFRKTSIPVIVVQQYPLNLENIWKALSENFTDYSKRYNVIERIVKKMHYLETRWKTIQYYTIGIDTYEASNILRKTMIYSPVPEPLRIAHQIVSMITRKRYSLFKRISGPAGI